MDPYLSRHAECAEGHARGQPPPPQPRGKGTAAPPIGGSRRVHRRPDRGCDTGGRYARERD